MVMTFAVVLGFRVLVGLVRLGFGGRSGYGREGTVVRRDRSLGGKEVVVGRVEKDRVDVRKKKSFGMLDNPLSMPKRTVDGLGRLLNSRVRVWEKKKLPSWWPSSMPQQSSVVDKDYYQSEADRLVRGLFVGALSFSSHFHIKSYITAFTKITLESYLNISESVIIRILHKKFRF